MSWLRPHSARINVQYRKKIGKTTTSLAFNGNWVSRITRYSYNSKENVYIRTIYDPRTICSLNLRSELPRSINVGFMIENLFNYKDKAVDSAVQLPNNGIMFVATLGINISDLLKL